MDAALTLYLTRGARLGAGAERFLVSHAAGAATYAEALLRDIAHNERPEDDYSPDDVFRLGEKAAPGFWPWSSWRRAADGRGTSRSFPRPLRTCVPDSSCSTTCKI